MSTTEAATSPAQQSPSPWRRSVWPLVLGVALPLFVLGLIEEHWLSLEGRTGLIFGVGIGGAAGVTVALILGRLRERRQRREAAD
ncbi:hypothetical protein [Candidatus Poriferisodalis sp.]|uniref:hypothetical protein n=1 Tax=Candidatus Poriferisodalis sp. TaxID=3101277 RepID=UPI003B01D885